MLQADDLDFWLNGDARKTANKEPDTPPAPRSPEKHVRINDEPDDDEEEEETTEVSTENRKIKYFIEFNEMAYSIRTEGVFDREVPVDGFCALNVRKQTQT